MFSFRQIIAFFLLLVIASCSDNKPLPSIPGDVLNPDSMSIILRDLHLMDSGVNGHFFQSNNITSDKSKLRNLVFEKHRVKAEYFFKSMDYYTANPERLDTVYQKVIVELSKMQTGPN
jgi:hypothetical protein